MEEENPWKLGGSDFFMQKKEEYMRRALELARKGEGHTSPNPMVGCVVVKDGRIISEGYHEKYGEFHAERNALTRCTEDTAGADLYVTLEPCCHSGKQPPCVKAILQAGISRAAIRARHHRVRISSLRKKSPEYLWEAWIPIHWWQEKVYRSCGIMAFM